MKKFELKMNLAGSLGAVLVALALAGSGCERVRGLVSGKRPNVLIITLDTTRADHLGCYGYPNIKTPNLDRLAAEGVRFADVYAAAPITLPSHASILTGTYPIYHGAHNNGTYQVDGSITTAAEIFKSKGYQTAAFIASFPLLSRFGLNQGFEVYDDRIEEGKEKRKFMFQERRAEDVNQAVLAWLERASDQPFFVWVHYFDPHFSYEPPSPFRQEYFFRPYDGEIAYMDAQLGKLLEEFQQKGLLDNTLVAVTADHGESLGEHNENTHAILIYYGTVRVPLILWSPKRWPAQTVVPDPVRNIDILPTLLDYAGIQGPPEIQGVSLRPLVEGDQKTLNLVAYTETMAPYLHFYWSPLESVRDRQYLYILAEPEELYDLEKDPREVQDLAAAEPKKVKEMRATLEQLRASSQNPKPPDAEIKLDAETEEKLRALGYIFSTTKLPEPGEKLPNPRFKIAMLEKYFSGQSYLAQENCDKALAIFDQILQEDPKFGRAVLEKGMCYFQMRQYDKALENFNLAETMLSEQQELLLNRAQCYLALKDWDKAEADFYRGLSLDPTNSKAYVYLARMKFREKNFPETLNLLLKAVEVNPKSEIAHFELGGFYRLHGKLVEAKNEFLQAMQANPNFAPAAFELGKLQYQTGEIDPAIATLRDCLVRDPKNVAAHALLGQIYLDNDFVEKAQAHVDIALALSQDSASAHFTNGNILVKKGKLEEAFSEFQKSVEINPANALAHKNLGALYALRGNAPQAIEHYRRCLELMPNQPNADKIKEALEDLEKNGAPVRSPKPAPPAPKAPAKPSP